MKNSDEEKIEKRVVLNWMPPAHLGMPSPAMSILKAFLCYHGYVVDVEYWNLRFRQLHSEFIWNSKNPVDESTFNMLLYLNYIAINKKDKKSYDRIKALLKSIEPKFINELPSSYDEHMQLYAEKTDNLLNSIIESYDADNILYWGVEANLYQWVCSSIIAEKIKYLHPKAIIIIGGIGTKKAAIEFLRNFQQFDIAIWGEGEAPLLQLSNYISKKTDVQLSAIANIAYRVGSQIRTSNIPNRNYIDLSSLSIRPDYSDYISAINEFKFPIKFSVLSLEGSRGCHWRKCHFCYLNNGYKYRLKKVPELIDEIKSDISIYNICKFQFLDNDLIGNDFERFDQLLDGLIEIRNQHPEFCIQAAEIVTKGLNASIIKKMSIANINYVQIGYESPSDSLLRKISKKNTFASNLLFLKFAHKYNIGVLGTNIIKGLLEETDEDIIESIENLHFLRFLIGDNYLYHSIIPLIVNSASPYIKEIGDKVNNWSIFSFSRLLPDNYILYESRITLLEFYQSSYNFLWDRFMKMEEYYRTQKYSYCIIPLEKTVRYREFCNSNRINELEFEKNEIDWKILRLINNEVLSADSLYERLHIENPLITKNDIINTLDELASEKLIFHNYNYSENVSILNIIN